MPTCTTKDMILEKPIIYNLILPIPDTDFRNFIEEVTDLSNKYPEIIARIEEDLDLNARKKKEASPCRQEIY